jgi:hypothetical protein
MTYRTSRDIRGYYHRGLVYHDSRFLICFDSNLLVFPRHAAGDPYPIRETMIIDGVGTVSIFFYAFVNAFARYLSSHRCHDYRS